MKIKSKNTEINYTVKKTNNTSGLAGNDCWLIIDFNVKADDYSYHNKRESLSLGEIIEACNLIRKYYDEPVACKKKITFIKNYFIIYINNTPIKKQMILELIDLNDANQNSYKVLFENQEILEFAALSRNIEC